MLAVKQPFQDQLPVLIIKTESLTSHSPGTRGQSDIAPESL